MKRILAMLLAIALLVGNVPVQAFATEADPQETLACVTEGCTYGAGHTGECSTFVACGKDGCTYKAGHAGNCSNYVEPKLEPAKDAAVYVTVSNRGELGMAYEEVTVSDINQDGKLSVDEALHAAHTVYGKGYATENGAVTKLWDEETSNVSFFLNHAPLSADVSVDTVSSGDYLVASVDQDTANDYDKYSRFDVMEKSVSAGSEFTLTLTDDAGNALAGMEIGLSNGNGTTTMTGLTTDVNGAVTLTLDQEGLYCVTARGTVVESSIDVNTMEITSIETPIIAPVCVVIISGNVESEAGSTGDNSSNPVVPTESRTTWNNRSDHSVTVGFTVVDCLDHNVERMRKELTVTPGLALQYFPDGQYGWSVGMTTEVGENDVTPIDVLVAAHLDAYGDAFTSNPGDYIEGFDYAIKMFGEQSEITWTANGIMPYNESGYGYAINQYVVQNGDEICFYRMSFYAIPANVYASFNQVEAEVKTGEELTLRLGYCATMDYYDSTFAAANTEIFYLNEDGTLGSSTGLFTDGSGEVTVSFDEAGTYYLTCRGEVEYTDMMGNPTSALSPAYIKINVENAAVAVASVTLDKSEVTLETGETVTLTATVNPENATDKSVTWESSNTAVATVADGVVTAVAAGEATITAKAGEKTATCTVTVNAPAPELYEIQTGIATVNQNWIDATSIYLDADVVSHTRTEGTNEFTVVLKGQEDTIGLEADLLSYKKNQIAVLSATVSVNGAVCGTVTTSETGVEGTNGVNGAWPGYWTGGSVTPAWTNGKADVTLDLTAHHSILGDQMITYVLHLIIEGNEGPAEVAVENVSLDKSEETLEIGETVTLTATVSPEDATDKTVTWTSDNEAVATVADGVITAVSEGSATITATSGEKTATCTVTVNAKEIGMYQIDTGVTEVAQNNLNATAIRLGANVLYCNPSSNNANEYFVVLAADTDKTAAISLEMDLLAFNKSQYGSAPSVSVNSYKSGTITAGDTGKEGAWPGTWTGATVIPTWNENGEADVVFSLKIGRNAATTYLVHLVIGREVSEVTLNKTETAMRLGETLTLTTNVSPKYTADATVDWSTSDTAVVTVADGVVSAAGLGTATITAEIGGKTASCMVTVVANTSTVIQTNDKAVLGSGERYAEAYITEIDVGGMDLAFHKILQTATTEMKIYIILDENTPDDAAVMLDFTLGALTSPGLAKVTGADPVAVKLENGQATYEVQAMNYANTLSHKYTIVLRNSNALPALKEGIPTETSVELLLQEQYNVNLAEIFEDADDDDLNYTVTIGGETTTVDAKYTYDAWETGEHTLVFKANDGFGDSAAYTVKVTVTESGESYETIVKVPDAVTPSFYMTQGFEADGTDKLGGELTAVKGESKDGWTSYSVSVPGSISWISVRGTDGYEDWGGMAFAVEKDAVIALRQVRAVINSKVVINDESVVPTPEQAVFKVEYVNEVSSCFAVTGGTFNDNYGFLGYRFLLVAADNSLIYTYYAEPLGELTKTYATNVGITKTITTDSAALVTTTLPLATKSPFTITAPVDARVQMFRQTPGNYYGNVEIPAFETKDNGDGTKTVTFSEKGSGTGTYRVSMDGKITKAGYVSGDGVTVTWDESDPGPNYRRAYDFSVKGGYYQRADDSMVVNVNYRNNLLLSVGETHTLRSYRIWQIINNDTQNVMIEPDFHINVLSGSDVIDISEYPDYHGNGTGNRMNITALKEGTAILEVTYDAIAIMERQTGSTEINGMGGLTFNACDPDRTALMVVQVGAVESDINFGILNNGGNGWDAEYDTLYFLDDHGQLEFNPTVDSGTISQVAVSVNKGASWTVLTGSNGTYTANIVPGNNIIRITKGDGTVSYQLVRGDKMTYTVEERLQRGGVTTADGDGIIEPGEAITIDIHGGHVPFGKMAGISNPWSFRTRYSYNGQIPEAFTAMYCYAHVNKVYLTIPEDAQTGDQLTLTNGYTELSTNFGGVGGYRDAGDVVPPNLDAPDNLSGTFNIFPDLTITVGDSTAVEETVEAESVSLDQTVATVEVGKTITLTATVTPANTTDKTVTWSSSNTAVAQVSAEGIVTALAKGTATITAVTTNGKSAECVVTVTEAEPEVPELDFGLAENEIVGYVTVSIKDHGIRKSSELSSIDQKFRQPLGTIVEATRVPFKAYDTIAAVTLRLLDALNMTASHSGSADSGFYLSAIGNFTIGETTYDRFGEFDAGVGSGWMVTWTSEKENKTDWFINKGASEFYVNSGDEIKWQYTCQLGADIGDTYSKAAVEAVEKLITEIGDVTLGSEDAIQAARTAYNKLAPVQQAAVSNYDVLTAAEATLAALKASEEDKTAANNVINLIEAIGDEITEESKDEIEAARAAYEALTDDQKKLVTNYDDLTAAEDYLELLTRVDADIANIYKTTGDYLADKAAATDGIGVGSTNGEWLALGLARSGRRVPASYYEAAVAYVKENIRNGRLHEVKSTENTRLILALTAIGKDVTDVDSYNLLTGLNDLTYIGKQGVNGLIYALIALDSYNYTPVGITRDDLVAAILIKQLNDGGWSLGTSSEVDLTAMAVQALAPYYNDAAVKAAVDKGLTWLSDAQNLDGSFSTTDGSNAESIAQVIVALTALGIDPGEDSHFIKTGITPVQALAQFYVEGGGFEHIEGTGRDDMATEQGYYALAAYARFKAGQTALYDMSDVTIETSAANQAAANNVIRLINAIGTVDRTKEDEIDAAREAYDALTETQKDLVTNYKTLTDAETALAQLKQTAADTAAANEVKALIDDIGTVTSTSQVDEIEAARRAYNALTTLQKNLVGAAYLNKLEAAEDALDALEKAEADEAAASAVEQKISAIGSNITLGSESKINTARNAYNALTADQKALVSNYQTLVNAEAALNALKSTVSVTFTLLGCYKHGTGETTVHTLAGGNLQTWIAAKTYKVKPGATVKDLFEQALKEAGLTWKNPTGNYVESITRNGVTIGEFTNGNKSGWMYTLNGKHPGLGVNQQTLVNGDKVVFHYTDDYTKEEGSISGSTTRTTTGTTSGTVSGSTNYITTTTTKVNTETAESVDRLIEDIGEEITLESEAKILAARAAYDKLTEAQKKLVKKYDVLVAAEAKLAELKGASAENAYMVTGDYIQGLGTPGVGAIGGEWMVIGLARSGRPVPTGYYDHVLNYVRENINEAEQLHTAKSSDNARLILALTAIGKDVTNVDGHDLLKGLNDMDYIQKQGINGPIWALLAFDSGNYPVPMDGNVSREALIEVILDAQLSDGGWALSGERSDPDMTGMAIQALAPYMESDMDVKKAVEEAIWTLSELQNDNGAFSSVDGPNSESIAQVIVALAALGIDADTDARFVKNGISALDALLTYYIPGGGFRHILDGNLDGMSTEQAYYALVAYERMKQNQNFLYDMTDIIDAGGDVILEETTEPTEAPTEPLEEEEEDNGNNVVIWTGVMSICAAAIAVLLLNRKKLFGKF